MTYKIDRYVYPYGRTVCKKCGKRFSYKLQDWVCREDNPNIKVLFCPHCGNKITEFYARRLGGDMI